MRLFGLSASGVYAYLRRRALERRETEALLARQSLVYAASTIVALFALVRLRVGLNYSPSNLALMLAIYALAAIPFFTGGLVLTLAISRLAARINVVYAADLTGAALGCLVLIPLLNSSARRASCWWQPLSPPWPPSCSPRHPADARSA